MKATITMMEDGQAMTNEADVTDVTFHERNGKLYPVGATLSLPHATITANLITGDCWPGLVPNNNPCFRLNSEQLAEIRTMVVCSVVRVP